MRNALLFLVTAVAVFLASPALADDSAVLTYHYKIHKRAETISPVQRTAKRVDTDVVQTDEEKDLTVTLLPAKFSVRNASDEKIYDFDTKMFYHLDHAAKTATITPLHALVLERKKLHAEMPQQAVTFETITGSGRFVKTMSGHALDTKGQALDLDTLYGSIGNTGSLGMLTMTARAKQKSFETSSGTIAEFTPSDKRMAQSLLKSYNNFLVHVPALHPDVEKYMGVTSAPFQKLDYKTDSHTGTRTDESWELLDIKLNKEVTVTSLPDGYKQHFTSDPELEAAFQAAQKPGPKAADYAQMIKGHTGQGDALRALLKQNEMLLSITGEEAITQDNLNFEILKLPSNDMIKNTMKAVREKQTTQNGVNLTNEYLKIAKKDYKDYVYFLDIFRARNIRQQINLDIQAGKPYDDKSFGKALKMYANALSENPWLATVYADLGDAHFERGNATFAWTCWLQALKLKPDLPHRKKMDGLKAAAEKEFPEYF